jgi:hypothetical protein
MATESKPTTDDNNNFTDLIVEQLLEIHNRWGNAVFETLTRPWQKKIPS